MKKRTYTVMCVWGILGLFLGFLSLCIITIAVVLPVRRAVFTNAAYATAASLLATVQSMDGMAIPRGGWHAIDDDTCVQVVRLACEQERLDMSGGTIEPSGFVVDRWGGRFRIAARQTAENGTEYLVWSLGADQTPGTEDDIVAPYGCRIPEELLLLK